MSSADFNLAFDPQHGQAVEIAKNVQRVTAPNESPFTFRGTNSYIIGDHDVALIDPGPDIEAHFQTLCAALKGRRLTHILVSHTHRDHSPLAARMSSKFDCPTYAEGPHRSARQLELGEVNMLGDSSDLDFKPDYRLVTGDIVEGDGWVLEAIHTPGHTANHLAFAMNGTDILFSADHVMGWATSIVAPPDGAMSDYMASLDLLLKRSENLYFPGHGGRVENAHRFVRALKTHRKIREKAVLERVQRGDRTIVKMVQTIYRDTDKRMHGAAALSVLAHLEDLVARGLVKTDGYAALAGEYLPV